MGRSTVDDARAELTSEPHLARRVGEPTWLRACRPLEWVGMAAVMILMLHVVVDTTLR